MTCNNVHELKTPNKITPLYFIWMSIHRLGETVHLWFNITTFMVTRRNQVNFLIYGPDSKKKKIGSVGWQNKNNIIWFLGSVFFLRKYFLFCIGNTEEKPAIYHLLYNSDKCFLVLVICVNLLRFISHFFFKKRKIID